MVLLLLISILQSSFVIGQYGMMSQMGFPQGNQGIPGGFNSPQFPMMQPGNQGFPQFGSSYGSQLPGSSASSFGYPPQSPSPGSYGQIGYPSPFSGNQPLGFGQGMAQMSGVPTSNQLSLSFGAPPPIGGSYLGPGLSGSAFGQFQGDGLSGQKQNADASTATRVIPPFLKSATPQQLDQFYAIVQNPTWSPTEKQQKIDEFVRNLGTTEQNLYAEFQRSAHESTQQRRQKVHQIVDEMSQEAQIQFQKVSAVMTNPALSEQDRLQKIQDIYSKISSDVKKEFDEKLVNL